MRWFSKKNSKQAGRFSSAEGGLSGLYVGGHKKEKQYSKCLATFA